MRAMSEENVEIVRRMFQGFGPDLDAIGLWHADLDYRAIEGAPDDVGVIHGHEALRHYYEQWFQTFDDFHAEPVELIDAGEKVVADVHVTGRMKGSSAVADMRLGVVYTVRDGKIARGREYATPEQAREVAGVPDPG